MLNKNYYNVGDRSLERSIGFDLKIRRKIPSMNYSVSYDRVEASFALLPSPISEKSDFHSELQIGAMLQFQHLLNLYLVNFYLRMTHRVPCPSILVKK